MMDEMMGGPMSSIAADCAAKSGGAAVPAPRGTSGPQAARNLRAASSICSSRLGGGSGIQRLSWNPPLLLARKSDTQALMALGCIKSAPQAPSPPAFATAIDSVGGQAPAIGARRIGARKL